MPLASALQPNTAQALNADEQPDQRQHTLVARFEMHRNALHRQNDGDHERSDDAGKHHRGGDIDTIVERNSGRDVVDAHHQRDQKQGGEGGAGDGATVIQDAVNAKVEFSQV